MAMAKRGQTYMPYPDALPFGISKATFFRRGWRRRDLHKSGWLELGIRITPQLRELMVEWFQKRTSERNENTCDPETLPMPPDVGIPLSPLPSPSSLG
jgi:hypothetical protein